MVTKERKKEIREAALETRGGLNQILQNETDANVIALINAFNGLIEGLLELTEEE